MEVLFIRPGGIGDAILLLPAIRALKEAYPQAAIDILAERRNGQGFSLSPHVRRVFLYDRGADLLSVLRSRYDTVIDTEQWHRLSAVVARFIKSSMKIGFGTNDRKKLFNTAAAYSQEAYEAESFFSLLQPLGIQKPVEIETPFVEVHSADREKAATLLRDFPCTPFVVLFPGASIPERRWGTEKFKMVAEHLAREGILPVVVGGREDAVEGAKIVTGARGLNLAGQTSLALTSALIDRCGVLVSGDSGILHIGVGLGRPTVSMFGPGIAKKWAPRGAKHIVLNKKLPCSPCTRFGYTPSCPQDTQCLQTITVEEVTAAVMTLLERNLEGTIQ